MRLTLTSTTVKRHFHRTPRPAMQTTPPVQMTTYTITELAREFDITARAIRFYEDQGLLSPKRLGLALSEIKSLVDMYETPKDTRAQMDRFLGVLAQHRQTLEQQRIDIEMALAEISSHEAACAQMLARLDDGAVAAK